MVLRGRGKKHGEAVHRLARRFEVDERTIRSQLKVARAEHPQPRGDFRQSREEGRSHTEAAKATVWVNGGLNFDRTSV